MSFNPNSGNPIVDAWLAALTSSLQLTTQLTSAWLGQQQGGGNPWAAMTRTMSGVSGGTMGSGWPMASMAGTGAANPWAAFSGGTAGNPFASLAGLQSMMSLAMATWGGAAPQIRSMPFPWNAGPWSAGSGSFPNFGNWANVMGGWPAMGQQMPFGGGTGWPSNWPQNWPMTFVFPGMPGAASAAPSTLPWPWNQFMPPQQSAATSIFGWPQGFMGRQGGTPSGPKAGAPSAAENDPMGFGQAMKFWSSLMPAASPQPPRATKPEPAPVPADPATDLTKLFPWMSWMK
jgi:hypothetical protein